MDKNMLLQTHNLSIGYKTGSKSIKKIAGPLNLEMHKGQLICLLGPNGSGKSTLIRTLAGLQPVLSGSVAIENYNIAKLKPIDIAKKLSMVLTDRVQSGNLNVYSVIALGRFPYTNWLGSLSQTDKDIIKWAIKLTETEAFVDRRLHLLSDGESQKVMLARALAQDTPIIILDEPTAHLDLPNRISLMRLLHQLARSTNKAIMLSTHDLDLALQTADQVWLLKTDGDLVKGVPEDMVLDGTFEAAFHKEGFLFDKASGTFIIHQGGGKTVKLTGNGATLFWTKRALLREGYSVNMNETADNHIKIVEERNTTKWTYRIGKDEEEHQSIASLLHSLKAK